MKSVIKLKPACFCPDCGEHFQHKRRSGFIKTFQSFTGIRKYHCALCDKTYYVYLGGGVKMDKKFI
jgi:formate dehydrogenase maturation protein FdhE